MRIVSLLLTLVVCSQSYAVDYSLNRPSVNYNVEKAVSYDLNKVPANLPKVTSVQSSAQTKSQVVEQVSITYRQPSGHTHTCLNCGDVWDHAKNSGHNCQNCGSAQYVQDRIAKLIPVRTRTYIQTSGQTATQQSTQYSTSLYTPTYSLSSGCANGSCNLPSNTYRWSR